MRFRIAAVRVVGVVGAVLLLVSTASAFKPSADCPLRNGKVVAIDQSLCVARETPAPAATATVAPTRTARPGNPCPDGVLNRPASKTDPWYGVEVDVAPGTTKRFCAPVTAPLVTTHPNEIRFTWYDVSDQDCGALNVRIDALDPPVRPRGGEGFSASGQYAYYAKVGSGDHVRSTPEQTTPGIYVVTVTGGPSSDGCSRFRIAWRVS